MTSVELENLERLGKELEKHSIDVYNHSILVTNISEFIGKELKLSRGELENLKIGALFHDIGKLKIPCNILNKKELRDIDRAIIKNHVTTGVTLMIENINNIDVLSIIGLHHLNVDGSGNRALTINTNLRYTDLVKIVHGVNIFTNTYENKVNAKTMKARLKESISDSTKVYYNVSKIISSNIDELYDVLKKFNGSTDSISKILGV